MIKAIVIICISMFTSFLSSGQTIGIVNKTVSDENSRTVYIGINNVFMLNDKDISIVQQEDRATVTLNGNGKLEIKPMRLGLLTVNFSKNNQIVPISFEVKSLPQICPFLGGQVSKNVEKEKLADHSYLSCFSDINDNFFNGYEVKSFTAIINRKEFQSGALFTEELKKVISESNTGDTLVISNFILYNDKIQKTVSANTGSSFIFK
jgi:hypothetical protein